MAVCPLVLCPVPASCASALRCPPMLAPIAAWSLTVWAEPRPSPASLSMVSARVPHTALGMPALPDVTFTSHAGDGGGDSGGPLAVRVTPGSLVRGVGSTAEFACTASDPRVHLEWLKDGGELPPRHSVQDGVLR